MKLRLMTATALAVVAVATISTVRAADDPLTTAKNLYASAAYEEALTMLTHLAETADGEADVAAQIDEYRSFCLYALGRTSEAEAIAQVLFRRNPLFKLSTDEISPRVDAMFGQVRKSLLPGLIREKYRAARAAIERRDFSAAEPDLLTVRQLIDQATKLGIREESLADLGVLVDGFLDLTKAQTQAKTAASAPTDTAAVSPTRSPVSVDSAPATPLATGKYDASDTDVTPPVVLRQQLPPVPPMLMKLVTGKKGIVEITIEPDGRVGEAVMRESVHTAYDNMVVNATKQWRYRPATRDGVAVRYVKAIGVQVQD